MRLMVVFPGALSIHFRLLSMQQILSKVLSKSAKVVEFKHPQPPPTILGISSLVTTYDGTTVYIDSFLTFDMFEDIRPMGASYKS